MLTFCTLFDSNYLDKGLVLYDSMKNVMEDFQLYILAMDDKCCEILKSMALSNVVVISQKEFEDEELLEIKAQRSRAEYCWTCTASLIDYVFETYREEYCTYIDSDLCFYKNPQILIEEMCDAGCSVQIVEHGFGKGMIAREKVKGAGRYCVQFNTFKNDVHGRKILSTWKNQCRNHCSMAPGEMGDQKYLSDWAEKYDKVHVLTHQGGGVAPWNLFRFRHVEGQPGFLSDKKSKEKFELIFYHFHHLEYMDDKHVNMNVFKKELGTDEKLVSQIYIPYLKKMEEVKKMLSEKFEIAPLIRKHPGLVAKTKHEKIKELLKMNLPELLYKVRDKMAYSKGKEKDLIDLRDYI